MPYIVSKVFIFTAVFCYFSSAVPTGRYFDRTTQHDVKQGQWDCELCNVTVHLIQKLLEEEKSWDEIAKSLRFLCIKFDIEDSTVCTDIINEFKTELMTVFDKFYISPEKVCNQLLGDSCSHAYDPTIMWNISLPNAPKPPVKPVPPPKKGAPTLKVLHVSDIHIDILYREGANAKCGEPICCRNTSQPVLEPAGRWGEYYSCDLPPRTLDNMMEHVSKTHKIDYVVWTGDLPAHYDWLNSQNDTANLMHYLTDRFLKYLPSIPVYSTLGNHEGVPVNSFPPNWPDVIPSSASSRWLYGNSSETWRPWLPNDTLPTIEKAGFYSTLIRPGLRMISLNMNLCNNQNWWLLLNMTDPEQQLAWFIDQLQKAENKGEKVQIIGHIPPGTTSCLKAWSHNFYKIINRYESTIVGQFFGHLHNDGLEIFYDPETNFTRATSICYIGPSLASPSAGNPGYTVYTIDGDYPNSTYAVLDYDVYIFNLTKANLPNNVPEWYKEYSAKEAYSMNSLQPSEWDKLLKRMEKDDELFQLYYKFYFKSCPRDKCTTSKCKENHLCAVRSARSYDPELCRNYSKLYQEYWSDYHVFALEKSNC